MDPALGDVELARCLQRNHALGLQRLEEVISQFAQLQEEEQQAGRAPRQDGGGGAQPSSAAEGEPASPNESVSGAAAREVMGGSPLRPLWGPGGIQRAGQLGVGGGPAPPTL